MRRGYLLFFLGVSIAVPAFAQSNRGRDPVIILFMAFTGDNRAEADELGDAMRVELEWLCSNGMYKVVRSTHTVGEPVTRVALANEDQMQQPAYLVNGIVTREEDMSVIAIGLWRLGATTQIAPELWSTEESTQIYSQELGYVEIGEALQMVPYFLWSLFSILPTDSSSSGEPERAEAVTPVAPPVAPVAPPVSYDDAYDDEYDYDDILAWQGQRFSLGLSAGMFPRLYQVQSTGQEAVQNGGLAYEAAFTLAFQFPAFALSRFHLSLGLQAEADLVMYSVNASGDYLNEVKVATFSLTAPLLLKLQFKWGAYEATPFLGVHFFQHIPLLSSDSELPAFQTVRDFSAFGLLGLTAGLKIAAMFGKRGSVFFDIRYSDISLKNIPGNPGLTYRQIIPAISMGYGIGIF
jgi:hypothetical protein